MQHRGVGGKPGLDFQRPVLFEKARVKVNQVVEHFLANIRHHPLANPGHQVESRKRTKGQAEHQDEEQTDGLGQVLRRLRGEALVHQNTQTLPQAEGYAGSDDQGHQCPDNRAPIGTDKLDDKS